MAKPGDVVELRAGTHGLQPPQNLGVFVARWRRKGVPWVRLVTLAGVKEVKAEHVTRRAFRDRYTGPTDDVAAVQARLRDLVARHADGALAEEQEDDLGALEGELWEAATAQDNEVWSQDDLARLVYGDPSPGQARQVAAALDRCRRPGTGRFETAGRGDLWRPWTRGEVDAMRQAWQELGALRSRLVVEEDSDEGRIREGVRPDDLDDAGRQTLAWVEAAMRQFVEHDGVPDQDVQGIGGLGAVVVFGMDLHRVLGYLATDWIPEASTTRSSDYVHFLLDMGLWGPEDAVAALMRRHVNQEPFFSHTPDGRAEEAAARLPEPAWDPAAGREDLRHIECYTIDPPDARDFDDAVGIEETPDGARLWVHIADVSAYVDVDGTLDRHARDRATSVYLPGRVLPMLPARISDHLCSLRDDGDRYALSVCLDIDRDARVRDATFHVGLIRVTENLSYADALRRRDEGAAPFPSLFALADRMRAHRRGPGIETGEMRILLEDTGFQATEKRGDDATRMIETFMVAANEAVARFLHDEGIPGLYRCHPLPDPVKAERFSHQAEVMGLDCPMELPSRAGTRAGQEESLLDRLKAGGGKLQLFGGGVGLAGAAGDGAAGDVDEREAVEGHGTGAAEDEPEEAGFAVMSEADQEAWLRPVRQATEAIAAMQDQRRADVATGRLLACMGQAWYTHCNEGHYGLGLTHYLHFTSPIRRYPDLVVHRNLKWHLAGRDGEAPHPQHRLENLGTHCSDQERAAAGLERRVRTACLVLAAGGGAQGATVTGITPANVFVRRDDGIEARVPGRSLPGGPYQVDEWASMLFLDAGDAAARFGDEAGLRALRMDEGDVRVRAVLGDRLTVRLAGRDVAAGRAEGRIDW